MNDEGGFCDDVNGGYLPEDLALAARRAEIAWVHFCKCLRNCTNARVYRWKQEAGRFDLGDADISVDPAHKKCRSRLCAREYKTEWQGKISRALLASQLCSAMPPLESVKVLVSIMMSVGWSSKCNPLKLMQYDLSRAHFQRTAQRLKMCVRLPAEGRQKHGEGKVGRLIKNMHGILDASHIWQLDYVNLICGELGGFRRGKHSAELFHNSNQDVRMAVHGGDFFCVCQTKMG